MTTASVEPLWELKRKVLVYAPDSLDPPNSQNFLSAILCMSHNIETKQGIISIRVTIKTPNPVQGSQTLWLIIPPRSVKTSSWFPQSDFNLCPARLLSKLPRNGCSLSNVSTLTLQLNTTARACVPDNMEPLSPHTQDINALEKIYQSNVLYFHFRKEQIASKEIHRLKLFLKDLRECSVEPLNLKVSRCGLVEGTLQFPPPPYSEANASRRVVRKQHNAPSSISSDGERQEKLLSSSSLPPDSDTEVNTSSADTQSIDSPSPPPIRATIFARSPASSLTQHDKLASLVRQLRGMPDDKIRELLRRSGHADLLARPEVIESDLSCDSQKASLSIVRPDNRDSIKDYVDATVQRSLRLHMNMIADENRELLYDLLREHKQELGCQLEDAYSDIQIRTDDCIREIEDTHRESIDQLEGKSQQYLDYIQDRGIASTKEKVAKFKLLLKRHRCRHGRSYCPRSAMYKANYRGQRYLKQPRR